MKHYITALCFLACLGLQSCGETGLRYTDAGAAIVLGDSSTIVTETDSYYLKDNIPDIELATSTAPPQVETPAQDSSTTADTTTAQTATPAPTSTINNEDFKGFTIDIGNATFILTGIEARELRKQDPIKDAGVSYLLVNGEITKANLVVTDSKDVTIQQRYQSRLMIQSSGERLELESLGYYTDGWKKVSGDVSGTTTVFKLNNLDAPAYITVNNAKIQSATEAALRKKKAGPKTRQQWMTTIKNIKSTQDKACTIIVKNVQWKISGIDAKGQKFTKNLRLDIP